MQRQPHERAELQCIYRPLRSYGDEVCGQHSECPLEDVTILYVVTELSRCRVRNYVGMFYDPRPICTRTRSRGHVRASTRAGMCAGSGCEQ